MKKQSLLEWCKENNRIDLIKEWDTKKNKEIGLFIDEVARGTKTKAWWICNKGHSYQQSIFSRASYNLNCHYCANRKVIKGYNDLETWCKGNNKEYLLDEWDTKKNNEIGLTINNVVRGSNKKAWWICSEGHSFQQVINDRTSKNKRCIKCGNTKVVKGYNDLKTWCEKNGKEYLLSEWDTEKNNELGLTINNVTRGSAKRVYWECENGHSFESIIQNRTRNKGNCPYCKKIKDK